MSKKHAGKWSIEGTGRKILKGTVPPPQKKKLNYSFDCEEILHIYVKSKFEWGNFHELFSIISIENQLFTENIKKGGPR